MRQAFDTIAHDYDSSFTYSVTGTAQRNIIWNYLEESLPITGDLNILELNCGTGEDALWFAKKGNKVLATDISEKMLGITQDKISNAALQSQVQTLHLDITKINNASIKGNFNLVFSNFGGMNCISFNKMENLPSEIKKLLKPDGRLVLVIMPRFCFWESIYFLLKFDFRKAFRRFPPKGTVAKFNGSELRTYYYSPKRIKKLFSKNFKVVTVKPVGFFIPPSYLDSFFSSKSKLFNVLKRLEQSVKSFSFLAGYSDHYIIDLQVKV